MNRKLRHCKYYFLMSLVQVIHGSKIINKSLDMLYVKNNLFGESSEKSVEQ